MNLDTRIRRQRHLMKSDPAVPGAELPGAKVCETGDAPHPRSLRGISLDLVAGVAAAQDDRGGCD